MRLEKSLSAILAALLLLPVLASCSGDTPGTADDTTPALTAAPETTPAVTEETTTARKDAKDNLPDDLSFGGETVNILSMELQRNRDVDGGGEATADIVQNALYQRNVTVEERLDVDLAIHFENFHWTQYGPMMRSLVTSGDTTYDFYFAMGNTTIQSSNDNLFLDVSDNEYIDYEQPWWWSEAMTSLSLDGKEIKYLVGDICMSNFASAGAVFFNQDLYRSALGNPEELYQLVLDGGWTQDKLMEMSQAVYSDVNGDGIVNEGDIYGSVIGNGVLLQQMEMATDVRHYSRNEQGHVQLDYDVDRAAALTEKMYKMLYETKGIEFRSEYTKANLFAAGNMLFFIERLIQAEFAELRDMESDYGIIPMPKMDEQQKEYRTLIGNDSEYIVVPKTASDRKLSGCVIEALCAESYRSVVEPYYETAMKVKYSRDALSGQCIDIIRDSSRKDLLYEYNAVFNASGTMVTDLLTAKQTNFASFYERKKGGTEKVISKYMENFVKNKEAEKTNG